MSHRAMQTHLNPDAPAPKSAQTPEPKYGDWREAHAAGTSQQQQASNPRYNAQQ